MFRNIKNHFLGKKLFHTGMVYFNKDAVIRHAVKMKNALNNGNIDEFQRRYNFLQESGFIAPSTTENIDKFIENIKKWPHLT